MTSTVTERPPTILDEMQDLVARQRLQSSQFGQYRHCEFRILHLDCAPPTDYCPRCKAKCRRVGTDHRGVVDASLEGPVLLWVRVGDYECESRSCVRRARHNRRKKAYFRTRLTFAGPRARYTYRAVRYGLDAVCLDGMSVIGALKQLGRVLQIHPSHSTLWRWQQEEGERAKASIQYGPFVTEELSGVICIDEMYEGEVAMIVCRDPLLDRTLGFMVVEGSVDAAKTEKFLRYLEAVGVCPEVAITDDSSLYPETLKRVWPRIRQQLCIFHVVKNIFKAAMKAVRAYQKTLPENPKRRPGRPSKRGRPRVDHTPKRQQVQKGRFLLFTRPESLSPAATSSIEKMLADHPSLQPVRSFALDIFQLFSTNQTPAQANEQRERMLKDAIYQADENLRKALKSVADPEKFSKMTTFLLYENLERTNNNVERHNRSTRKQMRARYNFRTSTTLELQQWVRMSQEASQPRRTEKLILRKPSNDVEQPAA